MGFFIGVLLFVVVAGLLDSWLHWSDSPDRAAPSGDPPAVSDR
jgi:hypothetical protein